MTIYFVRHGETAWNRAGRFQGRADSPLTLHGVRLAMAYAEHLRVALPDVSGLRIHTSPLGRALQTATLIADTLGIDLDRVMPDPLLAEHDVGQIEGLTWDEVGERHGFTRADFREWTFRPPGGESRADLLERAQVWLRKAHATPCVIVSHGGFSRIFRGAYLGLGPEEIAELPSHVHGCLFALSEGDAKLIEIGI